MLEWFKCLDGNVTKVIDCLQGCRLDERCLTLPTLTLVSQEREWTGVASTTQLLNGTMLSFLKLTQPYTIDPDKMAFALLGTKHHQALKDVADKLKLPSEIPLTGDDRDIFDLLEPDGDSWILTDYKTWGSYRVARALGMVKVGVKPDPTGAVYKTTTKWGKAGDVKMVPVFQPMPQEVDLAETELQLNRYRVMLEERGLTISKMQIQVTVRDGGLAVAMSRGLERNTYKIRIDKLDDTLVRTYFKDKANDLAKALEDGKWEIPCTDEECWEGARCKGYCEVARNCPKGILYQQEE